MKRIYLHYPILFVGVLLISFHSYAQRETVSLNSGWQFTLNDDSSLTSIKSVSVPWKKVNVPHTWNAKDIVDDTIGYHQGIGWYRKVISITNDNKDKIHSIYFEGVGNLATVFVNGKEVSRHAGSFTGFRTPPSIWVSGVNEILVRADNSKYLQNTIPPYSADFNMMGGIYRDVWLITSGATHFHGESGSLGINFSTPKVSKEYAQFDLQTWVKHADNIGAVKMNYQLKFEGKTIVSGKQLVLPGTTMIQLIREVTMPELWTPEEPNLYELLVQLTDSKQNLLDEIVQQVGFKWVGINANQEFTLNGKPYKLNGASRHQDYKNLGNALTDGMHYRDIALMKEMGCNFIRIAHYPQDPEVFSACDKLGLIAWCEIPVVDRVVDNPEFLQNSELMMKEMILQNMNHPCIAIWGYHNEVRNLETVSINNAKALNAIAKRLDKDRLTAIAFESNIDAPYFSNPLLGEMLNIADINGYNVYQGWYRGSHETISSFLDTLHNFNNKKPILLSEYGAGSIVNMHTYHPELFDFSEEYQWQFHRSYVRAGNSKPWMTGFAIWNFIDFQRDGREDVVPNINKKGMVTTDRQPKDAFYYYKAQWSKAPFIYITGKHWLDRTVAFPGDAAEVPLVVFSNQPELTLLQEGNIIETQKTDGGAFGWLVNFREGANHFVCRSKSGDLADAITINYHFIDNTHFSDYTFPVAMHINTGQSHTYFTDALSAEQWIPDQPYREGQWGYVGGEIWNTWPSPTWNGVREGIHKPIALTDNEPIFQTFVEGLTNWKADVREGNYRVTIQLAEPFTLNQRNNKQRIFSISLNGESWVDSLNLEKEYGILTAVTIDKIIVVKAGEGLNIAFKAINGLSILNGVSIEKL